MATITVTSLADSGAGSLRAAFAAATTGDTINFNVSGTINLTSGSLVNAGKNLTVTGQGQSVVIDGAGNGGASTISLTGGAAVTVNLSYLTLQNATGVASGGGIEDKVNLNADHLYVTNNSAGQGGGIDAPIAGTSLTITNSTIAGNSATGNVGGVFASTIASLTMINDTVANNSAAAGGGVVSTATTTLIEDSTIVGNSATGQGGGLVAQNTTITLTNSIVSGNTAATGKDIGQNGAVTFNVSFDAIGVASTGGGTTFVNGVNGNVVGQALNLGALANNGGLYPTLLPGTGSPVIGAGSNGLVPGGTTTDGRDLARISGLSVDIGAVEVQPASVAAPPTSASPPITPPPVPTFNDIGALFQSVAGVPLGAPGTVSPTITLANGSSVTNPLYTEAMATYVLQDQFRNGQITLAQVFNAMLPYAGPTSVVAYDTYQFFTGQTVTAAGQAYLINPAINANGLDGTAYFGVGEAGRFESFAVNLALPPSPGAALFAQNYGTLSFDAAARQAYEAVIGTGNALAAGINVNAAIAYIDSQQAYFTQVGGGTDVGAKAAMVGYLMSVGWDAHLGNYYIAAHDYLALQVTVAGQASPGTIPLLSGH